MVWRGRLKKSQGKGQVNFKTKQNGGAMGRCGVAFNNEKY